MKIYRKKKNGRYEELGQEFQGFPVDGIWLVWDGRQNCLTQLDNIKGKSIPNLKGAEYALDMIEKKISKAVRGNAPWSVADLSKEIVNDLYFIDTQVLDEKNHM